MGAWGRKPNASNTQSKTRKGEDGPCRKRIYLKIVKAATENGIKKTVERDG
jgi:hypothetical protein